MHLTVTHSKRKKKHIAVMPKMGELVRDECWVDNGLLSSKKTTGDKGMWHQKKSRNRKLLRVKKFSQKSRVSGCNFQILKNIKPWRQGGEKVIF